MATKITEHFTLEEMTRSDTATRLGIDNSPTQSHIRNLTLLCEQVLEPVRLHFNKPVRINSGYRSLALNMAINPITTTVDRLSKHCLGQAVDFEIEGVSNYDLAVWCRDNLPIYHQVILEFYTPGQPNSGWVHVSFVSDNNKKECLTATRIEKKTVYQVGLIQ
jgi:hypothetical protein